MGHCLCRGLTLILGQTPGGDLCLIKNLCLGVGLYHYLVFKSGFESIIGYGSIYEYWCMSDGWSMSVCGSMSMFMSLSVLRYMFCSGSCQYMVPCLGFSSFLSAGSYLTLVPNLHMDLGVSISLF